MEKFEKFSEMFATAYQSGQSCRPITELEPGFSINEAYAFSRYRIQQRLNLEGTSLTGKKIGVTSLELQKILQTTEPIYGHLTQDTQLPSGCQIAAGSLLNPRAEGEVAVIITKDLKNANITRDDILASTEVAMAIEIVEGRLKLPCKIQDVVADNSAAARYILSERRLTPAALNLAAAKMIAKKNGAVAGQGTGHEVMGDPVNSIVWLAKKLAGSQEFLKAGEVVLSGSFTAMGLPFGPGDRFEFEIEGLGKASFKYAA
jgi:2-keto-4-pentenoate hydratase